MNFNRQVARFLLALTLSTAAVLPGIATAEIRPATGDVQEAVHDWTDSASHPLSFARHYRSSGNLASGVGAGWSHNWAAALTTATGNGSGSSASSTGAASAANTNATSAAIRFGSGASVLFSRPTADAAWQAGNSRDRLVQTADGFIYFQGSTDSRWQFDASGRLQSVTQRNGWRATLSYNAASQLERVTNAFGRQIGFAYNGSGQIASITFPDSTSVSYAYDGSGRLVAASFADATSQRYAYEDTRFPQALTGVAQGGARIVSYEYDAAGRALAMQQIGIAGKNSVAYSAASAAGSRLIAGNSVDASLYRDTVQITDARGNVSIKTWQGGDGQIKLVASSTPADGTAASRMLGDANLPAIETDFAGVQTARQWDAVRQLPVATTEAANTALARTTQTTWHPALRLPMLVTEPGRITAYTYDVFGNTLSQSVTDTAINQTRTTRWSYGANNLPATMTDVRGRTWEYGYDAAGNRISVKDPLGQVTRYGYDAAGRVLQQTDPAGIATLYTYDSRGRVATQTRNGDTAAFTYTPAGQLAGATLANGYQVTYSYDAAQRLVGSSDNRGATIVFTLDAAGNRVREEVRDASGNIALATSRVVNALNQVAAIQSAAGQSTSLAYDANGQQVAQTDPLQQTTRQTLDALRRTTATAFPDATIASQAWSALDQLTAVTDPKGVQTQYTYNAFGEVLSETSPDIGTIAYTRDAAGDVIATRDAKGQVTRIDRDALGRPSSMTYADGKIATFNYDAGGAVTEIGDASGSTAFTRDGEGRVLTKTATVNDNPDNPSRFRTQYAYTQGELTRVVYPSGLTVTYTLNAGRITRVDVQPAGGNSIGFVTDLTYTALGQPKTWRWSNGDTASRAFDADGRMTSNEFASYIYDAAGRMTGITQQLWASRAIQVGTTTTTELFQTPITWTVGYDNRNRLTSFTRAGAETRYTYDGNSNRLTALDTISGASDFDAVLDGDNRAQTTNQSLNVEGTSNRLLGFTQTVTAFKSGKQTATSTTPVNYTVDANGAMTSDGLRTYEYDAANRLSKVKILRNGEAAHVRYLHNALGQRVFKSEPEADQVLPNEKDLGQDFVNWLRKNFNWMFAKGNGAKTSLGQAFTYGDGEVPAWALLGEYDNGSSSGKGTAEYIWLPTEDGGAIPVGVYTRGQFHAIHTDHLGTPRLISDAAKQTVWQWPYSTFGVNEPTAVLSSNISSSGQVLLRGTKASLEFGLRFPGQVKDHETGLYDNYFRTYDPKVRGGYIQFDPIGLEGGLNGYAYGDVNPFAKTDPRGQNSLALPVTASLPPILLNLCATNPVACGVSTAAIAGYTAGSTLYPLVEAPLATAIDKCFSDDDEGSRRCEKAKQEARGRYRKLVEKRIPQYQSGGTRGSDESHYRSTLELQRALRDAIRRVRLYCNPLPAELSEWEEAANVSLPRQH